VGLDRYKDWIVEWPEDPGRATYPRAFTTPPLLERVRTGLAQHPEKALLETLSLVNGKTESAIEGARHVLQGVRSPYGSPWRVFGMIGYMQTYLRLAWWVGCSA
jgi:hypothetical protein